MTTSPEKLEPCPNPWCEATTKPLPIAHALNAGTSTYWRVECGCGVRGPRSATRAAAITAWNTRAQGPALPRCAHCVAVDGPYPPGDERFWLARKLMDSKLTDAEAFNVVRHHPDISDRQQPPALPDEGGDGVEATELFDAIAFGQRLKDALGKAGLSYRQAQPVIGVDHSTLHRVAEAIKPPNVENYLRIVKWLEALSRPTAQLRKGLEDGDVEWLINLLRFERRLRKSTRDHQLDARIDRILSVIQPEEHR